MLTTYDYDNANRLTNVNGVTYTWDDNGNLLGDGQSAYTYDQANRLKTLTQGTDAYAYGYNGLGDRLNQTLNGTETRYVNDLGAGLTQVLSDGTRAYLYGVGRIAQQGTNVQYFGADGLGSVRQLYNSSGQIIANRRYDPFGNTISQTGVGTTPYGFAGEWTDATGLEYLRARYYSSAQGRFTTRDVWGGDPAAPMSYNSWLYVYANPVRSTDPSGLCTGEFDWNDPCWKLYDKAKRIRGVWDWPADLDQMETEDLSDLVVWLEKGVTFFSTPTHSWTRDNLRFVLRGLGLVNNYLGDKTESALGLTGGPLVLYKSSQFCGDPVEIGGCAQARRRIIGLNLGAGFYDDTDKTIHEVGHFLDWNAGSGYPGHSWSNNNGEWLEAAGWKDSCGIHPWMSEQGIQGAVTKYAQTSPVEDFAETFLWLVMDRNGQKPRRPGNPLNIFQDEPNPERAAALQKAIDQLP